MQSTMVTIDGSIGEGGGQIVRTALALSLVTKRPFRIVNVRAGRKKPGLLRQHLTAVTAASAVGGAEVDGAVLGSNALTFAPREARGGSYRFSIGTAGSTTLVLQTVLPALLLADGPSTVELEGGTHNPFAPPFDFLERVLLPLLRRMGATVRASLERPGFYPAGGGKIRVEVTPVSALGAIHLLDRGAIVGRRALARVSNLSPGIAEREVETIRRMLSWKPEWLAVEQVENAVGPGNVVTVEIDSEHVTELFTGFGERNRRAEQVASAVGLQVRAYLASGAPVGPYLADQLLIPMALAGQGSFTTVAPTRHCLTNIDVIRTFIDVSIDVTKTADMQWRVEVGASARGGRHEG